MSTAIPFKNQEDRGYVFLDVSVRQANSYEYVRLSVEIPTTILIGGCKKLSPKEELFRYFCDTLQDGLDDVECDDFTLSVSLLNNMFFLSFGRYPHAKEKRGWSTGDIQCSFYYEMNENLRDAIEKHGSIEIDYGYETADSPESIKQAIDEYNTRADEFRFIWDLVRDLKPVKIDLHCYLF